MAKIEKFEDMNVWKEAKELTNSIYIAFRENKDYSFRDQIRRASVSIMNNIAEGFERHGTQEFIQFLYIAKGSCGEVRSMLYLAFDQQYISEETCKDLRNKTLTTSKQISGLIKYLKQHKSQQ